MLTYLILTLIALITVVHAQVQTVNIYARPIASSKVTTLGTIYYDKETSQASFTQKEVTIGSGEYCIGTNDLPSLECFSYTKLASPTLLDKVLLVFLDADKNISHLSMSSASSVSRGLSGPSVEVSSVRHAPEPIKSKPTVPKDEPKPDDDVAPKSWIQRNWMYVVPPLLIVFALLGEEEKK